MGRLRVNTIYKGYMGEVNNFGIGAPCTFVRLSGCNIRCYKSTLGVLCDTPEALSVNCGIDTPIDAIIERVKNLGNHIICLTGGEPLMQKDSWELINELVFNGFKVVVETNGTEPIKPFLKNVYYVLDVKAPSTGEENKMIVPNYRVLQETDFIKFVIYDQADLEYFRDFMTQWGVSLSCKISVGLFWGGKLTYIELYEYLAADEIFKDVYVNIQAHKLGVLYDSQKDLVSKLIIPREL